MRALLVIVAVLIGTGSTLAQECRTVAEDKAAVEAFGKVEYLGPRRVPFTEDFAVFYRTKSGFTVLSPVIDGCVMGETFPVGRFKAEVGA